MQAPDQAFPIFDHEPLEGFVKESEFVARKNSKQVAVKIPEDLAKVESGWTCGFRREHVAENSLQGPRPVSQHGRGSAADLARRGEACGGEMLLFPAQAVLFFYGADKKNKP
jgi:hypothetical protein